jgi:hypothetical protein
VSASRLVTYLLENEDVDINDFMRGHGTGNLFHADVHQWYRYKKVPKYFLYLIDTNRGMSGYMRTMSGGNPYQRYVHYSSKISDWERVDASEVPQSPELDAEITRSTAPSRKFHRLGLVSDVHHKWFKWDDSFVYITSWTSQYAEDAPVKVSCVVRAVKDGQVQPDYLGEFVLDQPLQEIVSPATNVPPPNGEDLTREAKTLNWMHPPLDSLPDEDRI